MHRIVGGKYEQCRAHQPARQQEVGEDSLIGNSCKQHVESEKEHQWYCDIQRVAIQRLVQAINFMRKKTVCPALFETLHLSYTNLREISEPLSRQIYAKSTRLSTGRIWKYFFRGKMPFFATKLWTRYASPPALSL